MSIIDTHWLDADIAELAQSSIDEISSRIGFDRMKADAVSFFLNPVLLKCGDAES
jgi:hypothetical protein